MNQPIQPIEIFCCAAESDQLFLEKLDTRLTVQEQRGTIRLWDKSKIPPAANVDREIRRHVASARIFLLLIGPDFLTDDYCYKKVMKTALEKDTRGEAITIPVIVRRANLGVCLFVWDCSHGRGQACAPTCNSCNCRTYFCCT